MSADVTLRWGYQLGDLHRLSRVAAAANRHMAADHQDLIDAAWSAMAERLYAGDTPPTDRDLAIAGQNAIRAIAQDHRQTYGYRNRAWDAGLGSAPRFVTYWQDHRVTPSHEDGIVERLTAPQLVAALTPHQRSVIGAVAAHNGDRQAAADALGCTEHALSMQLRRARRAALALWLEHETPARPPRRRLDNRPVIGGAPCGTESAASRHRRRREPLDDACRQAERVARQAWRARRAAA